MGTDNYQSRNVRAGIASWYWWIYGVNFIIYLLTSPRIRQAYCRFLSDMICRGGRVEKFRSKVKSETFWAARMENGVGNHQLSQHNNRDTSNIMEGGRRTRTISLSGSGRTTETKTGDDLTKHRAADQLPEKEEVMLLRRRLETLELELSRVKEDIDKA